MGRKTFESTPKPLPDRMNVVITRQENYSHPAKNVVVVHDLEEAVAYCRKHLTEYGDEVFITGGGEIYKESMDIADTLYITRVHTDFQGDTHYPDVDLNKFELIEKRERTEPVPFSFETYVRRKAR